MNLAEQLRDYDTGLSDYFCANIARILDDAGPENSETVRWTSIWGGAEDAPGLDPAQYLRTALPESTFEKVAAARTFARTRDQLTEAEMEAMVKAAREVEKAVLYSWLPAPILHWKAGVVFAGASGWAGDDQAELASDCQFFADYLEQPDRSLTDGLTALLCLIGKVRMILWNLGRADLTPPVPGLLAEDEPTLYPRSRLPTEEMSAYKNSLRQPNEETRRVMQQIQAGFQNRDIKASDAPLKILNYLRIQKQKTDIKLHIHKQKVNFALRCLEEAGEYFGFQQHRKHPFRQMGHGD
jgi:hypothetical protein